MRQKIVDLTNKGYLKRGEFFGIQYDPRHKKYEVWCAGIKRFARLDDAEKYLSLLAPGWDAK